MPLRNLQSQLLDAPDQDLLVELQGPTAPRIRRGILEDPSAIEALPDLADLADEQPPPELPLADVVELFLRGLNAGLLHAASQRPWNCQGQLTSDELDESPRLKRWQLSLRDVHRGAFHVLRNLLRSLEPERVLLRTIRGTPHGRLLPDLTTLPYPPHAQVLPFPISRAPSLTDGSCQAVRITFREPLDERKEAPVFAALDAWAHLLMLGGYQEDADADRGRIGAAPNPPSLVDSHTAEMTFEVFNSAPAAIDAFINLAHRLHQTTAPVESLELE
jgi:hypothetical protein